MKYHEQLKKAIEKNNVDEVKKLMDKQDFTLADIIGDKKDKKDDLITFAINQSPTSVLGDLEKHSKCMQIVLTLTEKRKQLIEQPSNQVNQSQQKSPSLLGRTKSGLEQIVNPPQVFQSSIKLNGDNVIQIKLTD